MPNIDNWEEKRRPDGTVYYVPKAEERSEKPKKKLFGGWPKKVKENAAVEPQEESVEAAAPTPAPELEPIAKPIEEDAVRGEQAPEDGYPSLAARAAEEPFEDDPVVPSEPEVPEEIESAPAEPETVSPVEETKEKPVSDGDDDGEAAEQETPVEVAEESYGPCPWCGAPVYRSKGNDGKGEVAGTRYYCSEKCDWSMKPDDIHFMVRMGRPLTEEEVRLFIAKKSIVLNCVAKTSGKEYRGEFMFYERMSGGKRYCNVKCEPVRSRTETIANKPEPLPAASVEVRGENEVTQEEEHIKVIEEELDCDNESRADEIPSVSTQEMLDLPVVAPVEEKNETPEDAPPPADSKETTEEPPAEDEDTADDTAISEPSMFQIGTHEPSMFQLGAHGSGKAMYAAQYGGLLTEPTAKAAVQGPEEEPATAETVDSSAQTTTIARDADVHSPLIAQPPQEEPAGTETEDTAYVAPSIESEPAEHEPVEEPVSLDDPSERSEEYGNSPFAAQPPQEEPAAIETAEEPPVPTPKAQNAQKPSSGKILDTLKNVLVVIAAVAVILAAAAYLFDFASAKLGGDEGHQTESSSVQETQGEAGGSMGKTYLDGLGFHAMMTFLEEWEQHSKEFLDDAESAELAFSENEIKLWAEEIAEYEADFESLQYHVNYEELVSAHRKVLELVKELLDEMRNGEAQDVKNETYALALEAHNSLHDLLINTFDKYGIRYEIVDEQIGFFYNSY